MREVPSGRKLQGDASMAEVPPRWSKQSSTRMRGTAGRGEGKGRKSRDGALAKARIQCCWFQEITFQPLPVLGDRASLISFEGNALCLELQQWSSVFHIDEVHADTCPAALGHWTLIWLRAGTRELAVALVMLPSHGTSCGLALKETSPCQCGFTSSSSFFNWPYPVLACYHCASIHRLWVSLYKIGTLPIVDIVFVIHCQSAFCEFLGNTKSEKTERRSWFFFIKNQLRRSFFWWKWGRTHLWDLDQCLCLQLLVAKLGLCGALISDTGVSVRVGIHILHQPTTVMLFRMASTHPGFRQ